MGAALPKLHKLVVGQHLNDAAIESIQRHAPQLSIHRLSQHWDDLADADAFWPGLESPDGDTLLAVAPKLKWLQSFGAGVDRWLSPSLIKSNLIVTNASGIHGTQIAEHALGLILSFARGFGTLLRGQQQALHHPTLNQFELSGQTLLIIGFGRIARDIAPRAAAFGLKVIGVKQSEPDPAAPLPASVDEIVGVDQLAAALSRADHVISLLPLTAATQGFFDAQRFAQFKPGAYFYNLGRGASVDHLALYTALQGGHLAGAGLDVTEPEPLPLEHPLRQLSNVLLTAHTAGASPHYQQRALAVALDNLQRFQSGLPLINLVNKHAGY
ncbi:D-2-hydroxyacid dehydrogenase [Chitinibacter sp. FCG-7]|uniref:D-2-hydroxyacid dehydrogenase n=1 Tax=Chitinibacter mangrovi TaxID=3153927 RepID=A0AAU7F9Z5_9NEIS